MLSAKTIGSTGATISLLFCGYFIFFNPYVPSGPDPDTLLYFSFMMILPALLGLYSTIRANPSLLMAASIWSMPLGLYLIATPGVFKWMFIGPLMLLIASILMFKNRKKR
nr:hypothetical protein [Neobacillus sp. Marseille-Q6967]